MCPLDNAERYFAKVRAKYRGIDKFLIEVLANSRTPEDALSLGDVKDMYRIYAEIKFPPGMCIIRAREFLLTIPYIACYSNEDGVPFFYSMR